MLHLKPREYLAEPRAQASATIPPRISHHAAQRRLTFLYSSGQSNSTMRGRSMRRRIRLCVVSFSTMTLQHAAVLHLPARDLLDLGVPLDVDLLAASVVNGDSHDSVERQVGYHVAVARRELRRE